MDKLNIVAKQLYAVKQTNERFDIGLSYRHYIALIVIMKEGGVNVADLFEQYNITASRQGVKSVMNYLKSYKLIDHVRQNLYEVTMSGRLTANYFLSVL